MSLTRPQLLVLLHTLTRVKASFWITGGVAVDFLVGRWTREHKDLDVIALVPDRPSLEDELIALGFAKAFDSGWNTRWSFDTGSGHSPDLEVIFLEPLAPNTGTLVIPTGDPAGATPGRYPMPAGTLDPARRASLEGISLRICPAEYEWWARLRSAALVPGRKLEPKIEHDLRQLEALVPADRRAALRAGMDVT